MGLASSWRRSFNEHIAHRVKARYVMHSRKNGGEEGEMTVDYGSAFVAWMGPWGYSEAAGRVQDQCEASVERSASYFSLSLTMIALSVVLRA